jgi:HlyD family secretion protein
MESKPKKSYRILSVTSAIIVLVMLILYMGGFFRTGLIEPGSLKTAETERISPERVAYAAIENVTEWYEAVGTVHSRTETHISAQITGRIIKILVRPGDRVKKGDPLIYLDNREFQARLDQAGQGLRAAMARKEQSEQTLVAAQAAYTQAEAEYERIKTYFSQEAATMRDLEQAEASYRQAKAGVEQAKKGIVTAEAGIQQARKVVVEARVALGYTKMTATESGEVAKRLAEPGDLAWPGKSLLVVHAPGALRLEAHVREGLIKKVLPGSKLRVIINALNMSLDGTVEEFIPSADPLSRTFLVKAGIPAVTGLYPGMFGRLLVSLGERQAVVVPENAIYRTGQMEVVKAEKDGRWCNCFVKTGKRIDGKVEILSGLSGVEKIALKMRHNE